MPRRVDKPIRLTVMAIFVVIAYGILPLISVMPFGRGFLLFGPRFLPFNGSFQVLYDAKGEISPALLIPTLALGLSSAASAVVAFLGISEGRIATLLFVTLDVAWWFLLVITAIGYIERPDQTISLVGQLIFPPIWLVVVWWNYTRQEISAYYKQESELNR